MQLQQSFLSRLSTDAVVGLSLAFTANAVAQMGVCKADVEKLCAQVQPGDGRIARCLKQNRAQVSDPCKAHLKEVAQQLKEVKQACEDDLQQYCPGVKPGGGRVAQCLKQHRDQLSTECKTAIADMLEKS